LSPNGVAKISLVIDGSLGQTVVSQTVDAGYLIDKLEEAIPGDWDKLPAAGLKGLVKSV
jgi:hypothetical protein